MWPLLWFRITKYHEYQFQPQTRDLVLTKRIWYYNLYFLGKVYTLWTLNYDKIESRAIRELVRAADPRRV